MRIVRYLNSAGQTQFGAEVGGRVMELTGDIFDRPQVTTRPADVRKLLAPIDPRAIFCIGLNYRKHAEETKAKIPEFPVLFM
jgi:2-keto-4-pentenoate hydratase/2-oxohepta-3-ene-1,7-dioic acid hydratase in catechol pathway